MRLDFVPLSIPRAAALLAPAEQYAGGMSAADMAMGSANFGIVDAAGVEVGAYALRVVENSAGATAWVIGAAGSLPGVDLTRAILPAIESHAGARGCDALAITTKRPGLVRKLKAAGYEVASVNLRKILKKENAQ